MAASCVREKVSGDIILKIVNASAAEKHVAANLSSFRKINPSADRTVLVGQPDAENTFEQPNSIVPVKSVFNVSKSFRYDSPPMSLTVIRIKTK